MTIGANTGVSRSIDRHAAKRADRTPAGDDFIELVLDTTVDPVVLRARTSRIWGRRLVTAERVLAQAPVFDTLTEQDVLAFLIAELPPFVEK